MVIKELLIYGYGKFEQYHLKLEPYTFIYGKNEAGKSTIMSFIHSILFGFPLKQQAELRYEPKTSSKYGGQVVIEDPTWGTVRIERVKGRASGDVTVKLADGTIGGDELLQELLCGMDKGAYQSIFSFDIHGLQYVHKLTGDDLTKFLFSTSAFGTDQMMACEQILNKEIDKLYKPSGSKPEINARIAHLKITEKKLNEAKSKIANYESLRTRLESITNNLHGKKEKLKALQKEIASKKEWNRIYPLIVEKKQVLHELEEIGSVTFPKDGIIRYEKAIAEKNAINKRIKPMTTQLNEIEQQLKTIQVDERFIENKEEIQYIIDDLPNYRNNDEKLKELQMQLEQINEEIARIQSKLNIERNLDQIQQLDLSFAQKDKITKLVSKKNHLIERKRELDLEENELEQKIQQQEAFVNELEKRKVNDEELVHLENLVKSGGTTNETEYEFNWVISQLQNLKETRDSKKTRNFMLWAALSLSLVLVFVLYWVGFKDISVGVFIASILVSILYFLNRKAQKNQQNVLIKELENKKLTLKKELEESKKHSTENEIMNEKISHAYQVKKQIELEKIRLEQLHHQFNELIGSFSNWEREWKTTEQELMEIGEQYFFPKYMAKNHLLEGFELLEDLQKTAIHYSRVLNKIHLIKANLQEYENNLTKFNWFFPSTNMNYEEKVLLLKTELMKQLDQLNSREERLRKVEELNIQYVSLKTERQQVEQEIEQLFHQAHVTNEKEYYLQGEKEERIRQLNNQLTLVDTQLAKSTLPLPNLNEDLPPSIGEDVFNEYEQLQASLTKEIENLETERAAVSLDLAVLEEGGTYTELLHQYHQERYELKEVSKQWAVYQTARHVLNKAMEKYKVERLPQILTEASTYFSTITHGAYKQIFLDHNRDQLFIERNDGIIFMPKEVSQATSEQLYISLRLALAVKTREHNPLPLIIDDGFVHFDEERRQQMMNILEEISSHMQILYFSCHKTFTKYFNEEDTIYLP
ncbi:ATP-binding protein [Bacillus andreraoultii]|uniref:ATP-binding protein n=1 Tax=Bacillus andreraoultii TaxID=1499685 RepID=UPI000539D961|nr:AAA family ATPase [Bacillus andreraoultii]